MSVYIIDEKDIPENPYNKDFVQLTGWKRDKASAFSEAIQSLLKHKVDLNKAAMNWLEVRLQHKSRDISFEDYLKEVNK